MMRKSLNDLKEEMRAVARGERRASPLPAAPLLAALSPEALDLLGVLLRERPPNVSELVTLTGRAQSNISRSLQLLAKHRLVELVRVGREIRPEAISNALLVDLKTGTYETTLESEKMVVETTWGQQNKQTTFAWAATESGINIEHDKNAPQYLIPWGTFSAVLTQARILASANNNEVAAGVSMDNPTRGSIGAWVNRRKLPIRPGRLTPRHLSFIGPILGRMGLATHRLDGKAIMWRLN